MIAHEFWPSTNPRNAGRCACGRPRCEHPRPPRTSRWRDLDRERAIVLDAAIGICDPSEFIDRAHRRAERLSAGYVEDPMQVAPRNHLGEAREEFEDGLNRLVWWSEENADDPRAGEVAHCLRLLVELYGRLPEDD